MANMDVDTQYKLQNDLEDPEVKAEPESKKALIVSMCTLLLSIPALIGA